MRKSSRSFYSFVFCIFLLLALSTSNASLAAVRGENCYLEHFKQNLKGHDILNTYLCMLPSIYCYNWKVDAKSFETFEENYQKLFLLYGFNKFDFINERDGLSDTQVIIMSNNKMVMAVFRGSETKFNKENFASSVRDWITTDFAIGKTRVDKWGKGVKIHRGFNRALNLVYDNFKKKCSEHIGLTNKPLWVTGHSLGGALATLAAFRLETDGVVVHQTEVFGSPRVGNDKFSKVYGDKVSQIFRWVHQNDLITMVPPRKVLKYCHVTKPSMIYTDGKKVLFADENNENGKVSDHMGPDYGAALFKALPAGYQALVPDDEDDYENYAKIIKRSQEQKNDGKSNVSADKNPDQNLPLLPKKPINEAEKEKSEPNTPKKTPTLLDTL